MEGLKSVNQSSSDVKVACLESDKRKVKSGMGALGFKTSFSKLYAFCIHDPSRLTFSFKVGLAVLLTSLFILVRAPYEFFGPNAVWAIITVVVVFEYTVGGTLSKGFNRGLGSIAAAIMALLTLQLALHTSTVIRALIVGSSIFLVGFGTSLVKQLPSMTEYEYGFRVILLTYCLILASAYSSVDPVKTTLDRLYAISIGGIVTMLVSLLIFPCWAGDQLHNLLIKNLESLCNELEDCQKQYMDKDVVNIEQVASLDICKSPLFSSAKEDSLASFAKWEPPHGNFILSHPWSQYSQVAISLRQCACQLFALSSSIHLVKEAPCNLRSMIEPEMREATMEACAIIKELGHSLKDMRKCSSQSLLHNSHRVSHTLELKLDACLDLHQLVQKCVINHSKWNKEEEDHKKLKSKSLKSNRHSWPSFDMDSLEAMESMSSSKKMNGFGDHLRSTREEVLLVSNYAYLFIVFVERLELVVFAMRELAKKAKFKVGEDLC